MPLKVAQELLVRQHIGQTGVPNLHLLVQNSFQCMALLCVHLP